MKKEEFINLDDILLKSMASQEFAEDRGLRIKEAMIEFGNQLLKLAYENSEIIKKEYGYDDEKGYSIVDKKRVLILDSQNEPYYVIINKESITNTLNQVVI